MVNWKRLNNVDDNKIFENWKKIGLTKYEGFGFTIEKKDTISREVILINQTRGKWTLNILTPNEKSIEFQAIKIEKNKIIFVNDSIDFPKKVEYWREGKKLKAKISNEKIEIPFEFQRLNS